MMKIGCVFGSVMCLCLVMSIHGTSYDNIITYSYEPVTMRLFNAECLG